MKQTTIEFYRFQLVPNSTQQLDLFDIPKTYDEIKAEKNNNFAEVLKSPEFSSSKGILPCRLLYNANNMYCMQLSNISHETIYEDFNARNVKSEPFVMILINNDPNKQIIAISRNRKAYEKVSTVVKILQANFQNKLNKLGLSLYIEPQYDNNIFWDIVQNNSISSVKFKLIKPNLANISGAFSGDLRDSADNLNSHMTDLNYTAPKNGKLENLNRNNQWLAGIVDYASEGGGGIVVKPYNSPAKSLGQSVRIKKLDMEIEMNNISDENVKKIIETTFE